MEENIADEHKDFVELIKPVIDVLPDWMKFNDNDWSVWESVDEIAICEFRSCKSCWHWDDVKPIWDVVSFETNQRS